MKNRVLAALLVFLLLFFLMIAYTVVQGYTFIYPVFWHARVSVDGQPSRNISIYREIRGESLVLWRRDDSRPEIYLISLSLIGATRTSPFAVAKCKDFEVAILPGFAMRNHEDLCFEWTIDDGTNTLSTRAASVPSKPEAGLGFMEFTADDGRRIRIEW